MTNIDKTIAYQRRVVGRMIRMYCRKHHSPRDKDLCPRCAELSAYALQRIDRCPFGADKPNCSSCSVHCYRPDMRERIRTVMRYAGPRMLFRYPADAIVYLWRKRKKTGRGRRATSS